MIKINVTVVTDTGCRRPVNEDNFCVNRYFKQKDAPRDKYSFMGKHDTIAAVFDGIGGESAGEIASFIAAKTTARFDGFLPSADWNVIVNEINSRINDFSQHENCNLGCTAAMLYYRDGLVDICNLGDSRIYRYKDGKLKKISKDHNELQRAIDMNLKDFDPEKSGIKKGRLTKYLGIKSPSLNPHIVSELQISGTDLFIICSDGLTDMVKEEEICKIIEENNSPELAEVLIKRALDNGGKDNVTVMTVSFEEEKSLIEKIFSSAKKPL